MSEACNFISEQILHNLGESFSVLPSNGGCILVTPFEHPDMASVELFVTSQDNNIYISDDGETLNNLFINGLNIESNKSLFAYVKNLAAAHQIEFENSVLSTKGNIENVGEAATNLIKAIQSISFLIYKRSNRTRTTFDEMIEEYLVTKEIKYFPNHLIAGKANTHKIRFFFNGNRNILLEPIEAGTIPNARQKAKLVAYKWMDIGKIHENYRFIVALDDRKEAIWDDQETIRPITEYSTEVIRWSVEQDRLMFLLQ